MTHRDRLIELLKDMGIKETPPYEYPYDPDGFTLSRHDHPDDGTRVYLGRGQGYSGFVAIFEFDADGKYIEHEIVE